MPDNIKIERMENNHMRDGFAGIENKGVLWELMYNNGTFQGLSPNTVDNVKQIFENVVRDNESSIDSKTSKNKRVLASMTQKINAMKQSLSRSVSETHSLPVTAGELSAQRRHEFDNNLTNRQKDFNELVNKPIPKQIDFSDNTDNDKPLPSVMDSMINDVIAKRERDFNIVSSEQQYNNTTRELKIGNIVKDPDITNLLHDDEDSKRVSFAQDSAQDSAQESDIAALHKLMRTIDDKQDKIISMLKTLIII